MIKIIYALILGLLLAFFVGLGIEAFYPAEKAPEYPTELQYTKGEMTDAQTKIQQDFDQKNKDFMSRSGPYNRNVSIIAVCASLIIMTLALTILAKINIYSDGFLIGSLFTLLYGIIRGVSSDSNKFRFVIVTIGVVVAMFLGYIKFIRDKDHHA